MNIHPPPTNVVVTPLGRNFVTIPNKVKDDPDSNTESTLLKRFGREETILLEWMEEGVDLREHHRLSVKRNEPSVKVGDAVLVEEQNKKR